MSDESTLLILNAINEFKKDVNTRFESIDKRLDGIDDRLDGIDDRLDGIDDRLDGIDDRLDGIDDRLDGHDENFLSINQRLDSIDKKLAEHDKNFENINKQLLTLKRLENIVTKMEIEYDKNIKICFEKLSMLIDKTNDLQESINKINSKLLEHDVNIDILNEKVL